MAPRATGHFTRAAASSIASGSPSSRRQISDDHAGIGPSRARTVGRTACARATNSATDGTRASLRRTASPRRGRAGPAGGPATARSAARRERLPAGHQHVQPGTRLEQGRQARARGGRSARSCRAAAGRDGSPGAAASRSSGGRDGNRRSESRWMSVCSKRPGSRTGARSTNDDARLEGLLDGRRGGERQPRLAHARRPGERQQSAVGATQGAHDRGQLARPPDEGGRRDGQRRGQGLDLELIREEPLPQRTQNPPPAPGPSYLPTCHRR